MDLTSVRLVVSRLGPVVWVPLFALASRPSRPSGVAGRSVVPALGPSLQGGLRAGSRPGATGRSGLVG